MINDVVRAIHAQGHEITVVTGQPNYPDGKTFNGYKAWQLNKQMFEQAVAIHRIPTYPRRRGGAVNLILNYGVFVASGLFFLPWILRKTNADAILVYAPSPLTQAIPAVVLGWLKRIPVALWVQDLWPESLESTGFVKNRLLLSMVGSLVRGIYAGCHTLIAQSHAFIPAMALYAKNKPIVYHPNSFPDDNSQTTTVTKLPTQLNEILDRFFCVVFAGNLGKFQSLKTVIEVAIRLKDHPSIRIVLIGSGERSDWLKQQKADHGLENLFLPGRFPIESMPAILRKCSALMVTLNDDPTFNSTVPGKVQAYLSAGRPIIAAINGEGARVIREAGAGLISPAQKAEGLLNNILTLFEMPAAQREKMGNLGRAYYLEHFEVQAQTRQLLSTLANMRNSNP